MPKPIFMMDEINFPSYIIDELRIQGVYRPTSIQSMTWPALYSGRDIMCIGLPTHSRVLSVIIKLTFILKIDHVLVKIASFFFSIFVLP